MAVYQRRNLATGADVGEPGPLPAELQGLTDPSLADLSWVDPARGFSGDGYFLVTGRWLHKAMFLLRLEAAERIAIAAAAEADPITRDFLNILYQSDRVDLDSDAMLQGLTYLVSQELLTAERAEEISA